MHDIDGNIIAEYDASGALLSEYVWLEERPLAVVDHSGTSPAIYHVRADHLGRPIMMPDNAKAVVWEASFPPFGAVDTLSGPASALAAVPLTGDQDRRIRSSIAEIGVDSAVPR